MPVNNADTQIKKCSPDTYGKWALITGASEGIGKGFAVACAERGFNLIMIARRQELLESSAQQMRDQYAVEVKTLSVDLTEVESIDVIKNLCADLEVGMLINNAAYSFPAEFLSMSDKHIRRQIQINVELVAVLSNHFGNLMKPRGRGAIINVSSKTGEVPMPYFAMYSATKAFISTLSEAIWFELKDYGIDVLALKPCQTATEGYLAKNPGEWGDGIQTVEDCVSEAFYALGNYAGWLPWEPSRGDVDELRSMPLEDAIARNGAGMKLVFAEQLAKG